MHQKQARFYLANEQGFTDYAMLSRMREIRRRNRKRSDQLEQWQEYEFNTHIGQEIFEIVSELLPYTQSFWRHFAAVSIELMERHGFEAQPSVNMPDDGGVDRSEGYAMLTRNVKKDIRGDNAQLAKVKLSRHIYNVVMAAKYFLKGHEGVKFSLEEQQVIMMSCLLHDIGKLLPLAAHYHVITDSEDIDGLSRIGHAVATGMIIDHIYKEYFASRVEYIHHEKEVTMIKSMCIEHHSAKKLLPLTEHLVHCDHSARRAEMKLLLQSKESE